MANRRLHGATRLGDVRTVGEFARVAMAAEFRKTAVEFRVRQLPQSHLA